MSHSKKILLRILALLLGIGIFVSLSQAASLDYAAQVRDQQTKYRKPEDLLDLVPFLGQIPRSFLIGDGYRMNLSGMELRIDHMARHSRAPVQQRTCMMGFSYTTPVAGFFTSRIDLPLFNSSSLRPSDWSFSSVGDYVVYLSRTEVYQSSLRLMASARF